MINFVFLSETLLQNLALNYGLCILLIEEKINYLKIKTNNIIFKKISQMANKNKVLLNPKFDIVHLTK